MSWDDDFARMDEVAAAYFDSPGFEAVAMRKPAPNANYEPDASRLSFDFAGTLETAPSFSTIAGGEAPRPSDRSFRAVSKICLTALTTTWPWVPRQGDRIRHGLALYQVAADPERDGSTDRLAFWLNKVSG